MTKPDRARIRTLLSLCVAGPSNAHHSTTVFDRDNDDTGRDVEVGQALDSAKVAVFDALFQRVISTTVDQE